MRGETERRDVRHQWRRDNQDQHSAHKTRHLTSECARSLLVNSVQSCVVIFTHCTPHRVAQVVRVFALISSMHEVSVTLRLWALHSIHLPLLFLVVLQPAWHEGRKDTSKTDERRSGVKPVAVRMRAICFLKLITEFKYYHRWTRRPYTQRSSQQDDSSIRNASRSRSGSEAKSSVQPIQRKIEESDPQHGELGVLRNGWDLCWDSVPSMFNMLDDRYLVLHTRNLPVSHRTRQMNRDRCSTLSIPHYVIKKGPLHGGRHGSGSQGREKGDINPSWTDFKRVRFTDSHSSRLDGTKPSAHTMTNFHMKIIRTCAPQKNKKDVKQVGCWYSIAKVETVRWDNAKTTLKPSKKSAWRRIWRSKAKNPSLQTSTAKSESKRSQDPVKEPSELTRKPDGIGIILLHHQAHLRLGDNP